MLWDPRCSSPLCTMLFCFNIRHIHKNAIMAIKWSPTGNMFATASKDKTVKIFDIRYMKELQTFRGHKKEVYNVAWHSVSENLLSSGSGEGTLIHWHLGNDKEIGITENAHDGVIWEMVWHPEGHLLASVSNDHSCKLWGRNDPQHLSITKSVKAPDETSKDSVAYSGENDNLGPSDKHEIIYPQCRRQFQCYVVGPKHKRKKPKTLIPIGKAALSKKPTKDENEMDEKYLYDDSIPFNQPTSPKYVDIFDDEDITLEGKVRFTKLPGLINRMPQSVIDHIKSITSNMPRRKSSKSPLTGELKELNINKNERDSKKNPIIQSPKDLTEEISPKEIKQ